MRVLLVRLSSLGDVVLATAAVEALRAVRPEVEVDVLTKPGFREVFTNHPGVREVLPWDPARGMLRLASLVRGRRYDWIVDLHRNLRTAVLRALTPGSRWSGYRKGAIRRRLAVWLRRPGLLPGDHVVDRYLAALGPLGVPPRRYLPRLYPGDGPRSAIEGRLLGAGWDRRAQLVALAPGARWPTKAWPAAKWVELARGIGENLAGFPVLVGGAGEKALCREIRAGAGCSSADLSGAALLETAAALGECRALVTNDSAPLHLATSVGTPVVALFGPTVKGFGFFPLGASDRVLEVPLACRPCGLHGGAACPEGHHRCLDQVEPAEVLAVLSPLVSTGSS